MLISLFLILAGLDGTDPSKTYAFRPKGCPYQATFPAAYEEQQQSAGNEAELVKGRLRLSALCIPARNQQVPTEDAAARLQVMAAAMGAGEMTIVALPNSDCAEAKGTITAETSYLLQARLCLGPSYMFLAEAVFPTSDEPGEAQMFLEGISRTNP